MPLYPNPNGGSMVAANDDDAKAKGWTPSMGSFGVNTYPNSGGGGGGGGGGSNNDGLTQDQRDFLQGSKESAGFSRDELAERARQFNEDLAFRIRQWEQEGLSRLEIDKRAQALREWQAQQDVQLHRSSLGLQYLTTAAQMGGPASVFQQADFLRGARQRGDVPGFLSDLSSNTQMPAFTGAGNASIIPQTPGGLALQLGGADGSAVTIPTTGGVPGAVPSVPAPGAPAPIAQAQTAPARETFPEGTWIGLRKDMYGGTGIYGQYIGGVIVPRSEAEYFRAGAPGTVDMTREKFAALQTPAAPVAAAPAAAAAPATGVRGGGMLPIGGGTWNPVVTRGAVDTGQYGASGPIPAGAATGATTAAGLGSDPAGYSYDTALNQIGSIFKAGPTSLTPGSLERLDPNELAILRSGASKLGYDSDAWLRAYQRAGIGQAAGAPL